LIVIPKRSEGSASSAVRSESRPVAKSSRKELRPSFCAVTTREESQDKHSIELFVRARLQPCRKNAFRHTSPCAAFSRKPSFHTAALRRPSPIANDHQLSIELDSRRNEKTKTKIEKLAGG
jgi:hypothetical protein